MESWLEDLVQLKLQQKFLKFPRHVWHLIPHLYLNLFAFIHLADAFIHSDLQVKPMSRALLMCGMLQRFAFSTHALYMDAVGYLFEFLKVMCVIIH